jgi:hypothetical protein
MAFIVIRFMWFILSKEQKKRLNKPTGIGDSILYDLLKPVLFSYHCRTNCRDEDSSRGGKFWKF